LTPTPPHSGTINSGLTPERYKEGDVLGSKMDAVRKSNVQNFPIFAADERPRRKHWRWLEERLWEIGVIRMPDRHQPEGVSINWSTVTCLLIVLAAILGLYYFTFTVAKEQGYREGIDSMEKRSIQQQLDEAKRDAAEAKKLQTYSAGVADSHNSEKEKK
jgi:hypothetical protein